jgi:hypothetical protein
MTCHICSINSAADRTISPLLGEVNCPRCGNYRITNTGLRSLGQLDVPRYILSAALRYSSDRGKIELVDVRDGKGTESDIVKSFPMPKDPLDKVDLLLKGISLLDNGRASNHSFDWDINKSLIATDSVAEVGTTLKLAREMGSFSVVAMYQYVRKDGKGSVNLTEADLKVSIASSPFTSRQK